MEKKLLLVKYYGTCVGCPCRRYSEETNIAYCKAEDKIIEEGVKKPKFCPLKKIPARIGVETGGVEYAQGWNAAIDEVELG